MHLQEKRFSDPGNPCFWLATFLGVQWQGMALGAMKSVDPLERSGPEEEEAHPDGPSTRLAPDPWGFRYDFRTFLL